MRTVFVLFLFYIIFTFGNLTNLVYAETFYSNLSVGSRGNEVSLLQQFLVSKNFLEMPVGVVYGHFGPLTQAAVARWQVSQNITPAAGYFGPISRAAIALETNTTALAPTISTNPIPAPPTPPSSGLFPSMEIDTPVALGMRANQVVLFRAFPFEVRPGDFIKLDGSSFSKTLNKIDFNGGHLVTATSTDGVTLKVAIPFDLSSGEYKLSVANALGSSNDQDNNVVIRVTSNPQPGPTIESASIDGGVVVLKGRGFTTTNNLFTTFGNSLGPVSSDGTTLTFRVADLSMYDEIRQFTLGNYKAALWIYVESEHGASVEPYKLEISI